MVDRDPQFEQSSSTKQANRSWRMPTLTQCTVPLPLLFEIRAELALNERTASKLYALLQDLRKDFVNTAQRK